MRLTYAIFNKAPATSPAVRLTSDLIDVVVNFGFARTTDLPPKLLFRVSHDHRRALKPSGAAAVYALNYLSGKRDFSVRKFPLSIDGGIEFVGSSGEVVDDFASFIAGLMEINHFNMPTSSIADAAQYRRQLAIALEDLERSGQQVITLLRENRRLRDLLTLHGIDPDAPSRAMAVLADATGVDRLAWLTAALTVVSVVFTALGPIPGWGEDDRDGVAIEVTTKCVVVQQLLEEAPPATFIDQDPPFVG